MNEKIVPLTWEALDGLLEHIDRILTSKQTPVILCIRTQLAVEWLFSILLESEGAGSAQVRFTTPAPRTIQLQYRNQNGPLTLADGILESFSTSPSLYGIKMEGGAGDCTISIGVK